jgi:hypothetical protein
MPEHTLPEPPEGTIVAWWDQHDDLWAVAHRTDQHVEPGGEQYRWYIADYGQGDQDPLAWFELLVEMEGFRGPSELVSNGRIEGRVIDHG